MQFKLIFIHKKTTNSLFSHPLGELGVTYALHLWIVERHMVDFLFTIVSVVQPLVVPGPPGIRRPTEWLHDNL